MSADSEDLRLDRVDKRMSWAEKFMFLGFGFFITFFITSFFDSNAAWLVTGGLTLVTFVSSLGMLVNRR